MEEAAAFLQLVAPWMLAFLIASAAMQILFCLSLAAIARKTGQSELLQVLAWIPLLQMAPLVIAGGGSVAQALLFGLASSLAIVVLAVLSAVLGGGAGVGLIVLCTLGLTIAVIVYFARIFSTMAVDRGLPGWVGLVMLVPGVNLIVFPIVAFHDGFTLPNPIGIVIGTVLIVGSTWPSVQTVRTLGDPDSLQATLLEMSSGGQQDADQTMTSLAQLFADMKRRDPRMSDPRAGVRTLFELQERFAELEGLAAQPGRLGPERTRDAAALLEITALELERGRDALDEDTYAQLGLQLVELETRLAAKGPIARPPDAPIPVEPEEACPRGTRLATRSRDGRAEEWCEQTPERGGLRHGWYARFHPGGQPESMGEYDEGLRIGVWTRFYEDGGVRAQAEFREGLQHGWMLAFDEQGRRTAATRYAEGVALP